MNYFRDFSSNTLTSGGNQSWFAAEMQTPITGRVFYRITQGGTFRYSLLFSNIIDSTYEDGSESYCNRILPPWQLLDAKVGRCPADFFSLEFQTPELAASINAQASDFQPLTFGGSRSKDVAPGEFFSSDPLPLHFEKDEYLCLELTFRGTELPSHPESLLPVYRLTEDGWRYDVRMPLPGMIGCDRPVRRRIGFLGDSITAGCGTPMNGYMAWNAVLARKLPDDLAFWNLGLGYGRALDAASCGAWLYKALQNDVLFVCYGVNDLQRYGSAELLIHSLNTIVRYLTLAGKTVILQTIPPFIYPEEQIAPWNQVNDYIRTVLSKKVACVYDDSICLGDPQIPWQHRYGAHPDAEGCAIWGNALYDFLNRLPEEIKETIF